MIDCPTNGDIVSLCIIFIGLVLFVGIKLWRYNHNNLYVSEECRRRYD